MQPCATPSSDASREVWAPQQAVKQNTAKPSSRGGAASFAKRRATRDHSGFEGSWGSRRGNALTWALRSQVSQSKLRSWYSPCVSASLVVDLSIGPLEVYPQWHPQSRTSDASIDRHGQQRAARQPGKVLVQDLVGNEAVRHHAPLVGVPIDWTQRLLQPFIAVHRHAVRNLHAMSRECEKQHVALDDVRDKPIEALHQVFLRGPRIVRVVIANQLATRVLVNHRHHRTAWEATTARQGVNPPQGIVHRTSQLRIGTRIVDANAQGPLRWHRSQGANSTVTGIARNECPGTCTSL
eukprot:CAMPEP_0115580494 /NCGR_PEP_ID=MMETSP0272-20121206/4655_1 /TAXON_ID=71861 /ORGANISM="Scrippsiella trochoidea, Strain CCMP3099" /LENGTH=294 /DNA_ID=CAMNT_0003015415 /DNA_START=233 /DNA_END=1117 /DNA_ORIENTATION=-